jgi:hypothetical protein
MRAFLVACLAVVVIGVGASILLGNVNPPVDRVFVGDGARI